MHRSHTALAPLLIAAALLAGCGDSDTKLLANARTRLAQKDVEGARLQLKTLLQKNPQSAEARFLLGELMVNSGDAAGGEAELRRALEGGHPEEAVLPLLASAMVAQGKGNLLTLQFGKVELKDDQAAGALKTQLAIALAQDGRREDAEAMLTAALQHAPDLPAAKLLQARLKAAGGDLPGALAAVETLLAKTPGNAAAWSLKGDMLTGQGKPADALAAYAESLKQQPDQAGVHSAVLTLLIAQKDTDGATKALEAMRKALPKHPQTLFFDAALAEGRGDYARTRELTQQLLRGAPDNPRVLVLAGQAELKLNSLAQAETLFAKAVQVAPKFPVARRLLAQVQLRNNQPDKALATLAPLTEAKPPDTEALTLAGQAQMLSGNTKGAEASFAKAVQSKPDDQRLRAVQAMSKLGQGDDSSALAELESLAGNDKSNRVDLALISARLQRNDIDGALKDINKLAAKLPNDPVPDQLRGRIALKQGDAAKARSHFDAALAKNASYLPALASLSVLDMAEQKAPAARARWEALLKREPKNANAMMALSEIANRGGQAAEAQKLLDDAIKAAPTTALPRLMQIDQLLAQRELTKALAAAQAGVAALPDNPDLLDRLGRCQLASGEALQAVSSFSKLATMMPKSPLPQLRLADAHLANGNGSGVAAAIRRAQEIAPDALPVLQAGITLAMRDNKPEQALSLARRVQTLLPKQPTGLLIEGDLQASRTKWDDAAAAYRKALVLAPQAGDIAARLQSALGRAGKQAEADKLTADWLKSHPDDEAFLIHLGDQAMSRNANAEAEQRYRQVLDKHPDSVITLNNLAYLLASTGKPGGVALAEKAVKLAPKQAALLDTLALCLAADKQLPKALEAQAQAVTLAPDAPQFRLQLAKLQIQSGDKPAARSELQKLSKLGAGFAKQAEVAELLKATGG